MKTLVLRCPVANYLNFLMWLLGREEDMTNIDGESGQPKAKYGIHCNYRVSGSWSKSTHQERRPVYISAPEGDSSYGIVLGSSDEPVSPSDYKLKSKIEHSDTGLYYGETSTNLTEVEKPVYHVIRTFENKSSSDIHIREAGLIIKDSDNKKFLLFRDIVDVTLSPGEILTVDMFITV